jgi:hypothetical protein
MHIFIILTYLKMLINVEIDYTCYYFVKDINGSYKHICR